MPSKKLKPSPSCEGFITPPSQCESARGRANAPQLT
jgi:hypothetical protein